ncbi:von Willebrand factor [Novipirellula aureliae]|uniref:von Willebrand factor n=1 Tax=Novipirellula aureliae TaxID=2527966 RepID=A0A5C6E9Z0_9BACT|nr:von Willebrand factor type A domain-containing protein [Novipirellula aureliae]TWU43969.1 von Willebrand factor [Novipirellula aureliae]
MNEKTNYPSLDPELEARIVALVLGEVSDLEREQLERLIAQRPELASYQADIQALHGLLRDVASGHFADPNEDWKLPTEKRDAILSAIDGESPSMPALQLADGLADRGHSKTRRWLTSIAKIAAVFCVVGFFGCMMFPNLGRRPMASSPQLSGGTTIIHDFHNDRATEKEVDEERQWSFDSEPSVLRGWMASSDDAVANEAAPENELAFMSALSSIRESLDGKTRLPTPSSRYDDVSSPTSSAEPPSDGIMSNRPGRGASGSGPVGLSERSDNLEHKLELGDRDGDIGRVAGRFAGGWMEEAGEAVTVDLPELEDLGSLAAGQWQSQSQREGTDANLRFSDDGMNDSQILMGGIAGKAEGVEYGDGLRGGGVGGGGGGYAARQSPPNVSKPEAGKDLEQLYVGSEVVRDHKEETVKERIVGERKRDGNADAQAHLEPAFQHPDEERWQDMSSRRIDASGTIELLMELGDKDLERDERVNQPADKGFASGTIPNAADEKTALGNKLSRLKSDKEVEEDFEMEEETLAIPGLSRTPNVSRLFRSVSPPTTQPSSPKQPAPIMGTALGLTDRVSKKERAGQQSSEGQVPLEGPAGVTSNTVVPRYSLNAENDSRYVPMNDKGKPSESLGSQSLADSTWDGKQSQDGRDILMDDSESFDFDEVQKLAIPVGLEEQKAQEEAFSTFSLHVSDVSFKLARAALASGTWPEPAKIRIEEFVNAFDYGDPMPRQDEKVACRVEQSAHPFLQQRNLLRVSMRTAAAGRASNTPLRLTLLLDNSGSMERIDRQQTVRRAFALLAAQLKPIDQVTLISFARQPRLLADKVSGSESKQMVELIENLPSEGGTNIEAALQLAFEKAREQQVAGAQNRIILLTDGAVNLGNANPQRLSQMIEAMRGAGIAFDAAGISAEGLNDEILEALTRKGDGRYYLLDSLEATEDGFARQIAGALRPSAKNVKVQVEFNPKRVGRYKLLGFEKHRLKTEDFRNDEVDAAEMAAAEAGVAMYQFEALPDGEGDVGSVSVRFRDLSTGQMTENRWPIPYEPDAPRPDQSSPSLRIATTAALLAARLRGDAVGATVDMKTLSNLIAGLPDRDRNVDRVGQLQQMIEQARQLSGK